MLLLVAAPTLAERPPQFPKDATDIVTAKVLRIYTSTEPFAGDGVMTHYLADLEVAGASKGQLKEGDVISARWFHVTKSPSKPLPAAYGQNQPAFAGGAGLFIVPGQFAANSYGCYLMDVDAQTLCAYQWFPGEKKMRLVASRSFQHDRFLAEFNTDNPAPPEVKAMLDKQREATRGQ